MTKPKRCPCPWGYKEARPLHDLVAGLETSGPRGMEALLRWMLEEEHHANVRRDSDPISPLGIVDLPDFVDAHDWQDKAAVADLVALLVAMSKARQADHMVLIDARSTVMTMTHYVDEADAAWSALMGLKPCPISTVDAEFRLGRLASDLEGVKRDLQTVAEQLDRKAKR